MTDTVGHSPSETDNTKLSSQMLPLDAVSARFIAAGLPRSMRSLQRYCNNGTFDCVKEATQTGDAFFVHEHSVKTAIAALKQLHDTKNHHRQDTTDRAVSRHVADRVEPLHEEDAERHRPTMSDTVGAQTTDNEEVSKRDTSDYVAQLQARLTEKNEEIDFLREELIDRRGQIRDMKNIIDGQNQLLETIQTNVAPVFKALASTVNSDSLKLRLGRRSINDIPRHDEPDNQ